MKTNPNELNLEDLQTEETSAEVAIEKKAAKELTAEEIAAIKAGADKLIEFGVSADFAKIIALVPVWHAKDSEELKIAKATAIAAFGDSEKLKDYVDGPFQEELAVINGIQKTVSTLNNIKSFYARRVATGKVKYTQITIGGTYYEVNATYLAELTGKDVAEKRELLLAHADTKKQEILEIL